MNTSKARTQHELVVRLAAPSLAQAEKRLAAVLAQTPGVQAVLASETSMEAAAQRTIQAYTERVQRLQATATVLARELGATELQSAADQLANAKQPGASAARELERLERLASRAPELARIRRFLVELPDRPELGELRMQQELLAITLRHLGAAGHDSLQLDGVILHDFAKYHAAYTAALQQHLAAREAQIIAWQRQLPALRQQLAVLASLDTIPQLGEPAAPQLEDELAQLGRRHAPLAKTKSEIARELRYTPTPSGLSLASPLPADILASYSGRVAAALAAKLGHITEASTLAVLRNSREPAIKKLIQLASLTQLDKITRLFTPKTTPRLLAELAQLLYTEPGGFDLASWRPSRVTISSARDADQLGRELARDLKTRLATAPHTPLNLIFS